MKKDTNLKNSYIDIYEKTVIAICFLVSFTVMIGWFFKVKILLSLLPESATMKFNTALIFFIMGINLTIYKVNNKSFVKIYNFLAIVSIIIGLISIAGYFGYSNLNIDNLFVYDEFSKEYPGKMSPATALCSILIGFGFLGNYSKYGIVKKLSEDTVLFVALISITSLISYLLMIPLEKRTQLFQTMSLPTALIFFIISLFLIVNNNSLYLSNLVKGTSKANLFFRKLLPRVIFFPITLGIILLAALNFELIGKMLGVAFFVLILIFINIIYVTHISKNIDESEIKNE